MSSFLLAEISILFNQYLVFYFVGFYKESHNIHSISYVFLVSCISQLNLCTYLLAQAVLQKRLDLLNFDRKSVLQHSSHLAVSPLGDVDVCSLGFFPVKEQENK